MSPWALGPSLGGSGSHAPAWEQVRALRVRFADRARNLGRDGACAPSRTFIPWLVRPAGPQALRKPCGRGECPVRPSPDLLLAVMLAVTTGARQGELLGLRWKDVDLTAGVLRLRVDNETTTKGGIRSLPIVSQVRPLLADRLTAYRQGKVADLMGSGLVFPSRVSINQPVDLRKPFETALERAGIEGFVWHDLRHSAASFMAANGASLLEIGAVLGHKCAQTTARYSHLTEQASHALVRGADDKLLGDGDAAPKSRRRSASSNPRDQDMPSVTLKAHFDGRSILLDEPYQIPPHARLLVTLVEPGQDDERALWAGLSLSGLAGAYGEDEPDYGPADVKCQ